MAKDNWLEEGPIGDWQRPTEKARSSAQPGVMLTHQSTSDEVVSFVNGLSNTERAKYHQLQANMCPPGFRWSSQHRLVPA